MATHASMNLHRKSKENRSSGNQSILELYCEVSTCAGIIDWYKANHVIGKTFWITILTVSLSLTAWQTVQVFRQFVYGPHFQTTISIYMAEEGLQYPNVTICNYNRAKQSVINATNLDPKILMYLFQLNGAQYDYPLEKMPDFNLTDYELIWNEYFKRNNVKHPRQIFELYGHGYNETILDIKSTNGQICSLKFEPVLTEYGLCWKIAPMKKQYLAMGSSGIRMILNPYTEEYMTDVFANNYLSEGIILGINYVFEPIFSSPLLLSPGSSAEIAMTTSAYKISTPDTPLYKPDCSSNLTFTILDVDEYSANSCVYDCILNFIYSSCGCVLLMPTKSQYKVCSLTSMLNCVSPTTSKGSKLKCEHENKSSGLENPFDDHVLECMLKCRPPCKDYFTVSTSVTISKAMSQQLENKMQKFLQNTKPELKYVSSAEGIVKNVINVKMYFTTPQITIYETGESMPIFTFIGNVGGQLSLWTGISIITVVQLLYYALKACFHGKLFRSF